MARPRTFGIRVQDYTVKYDGTNVTTVLTAIKPSMDARYEDSVSIVRNAIENTRRLLNDLGVPTKDWAKYLSFASRIAKLTFSFSGATLLKEISGEKADWVYEKKADPSILDQIVELIVGVSVPY